MPMLKFHEKYYTYLDDLRESGITNMFGARPYLLKKFPTLEIPEAKALMVDWMKTFDQRHPPKETSECPDCQTQVEVVGKTDTHAYFDCGGCGVLFKRSLAQVGDDK